MNTYSFKDDPNTQTDDYLAKAAALNDLISTVSGAIVAIVGVVAPIAIVLSNVDTNIKLAAIGGGAITGGAGAVIGRQQPKALEDIAKDRLQQSAQSVQEG